MTRRGTPRSLRSARAPSRTRTPAQRMNAQSRSTRSALDISARSSAPRLGSPCELVRSAAFDNGVTGRNCARKPGPPRSTTREKSCSRSRLVADLRPPRLPGPRRQSAIVAADPSRPRASGAPPWRRAWRARRGRHQHPEPGSVVSHPPAVGVVPPAPRCAVTRMHLPQVPRPWRAAWHKLSWRACPRSVGFKAMRVLLALLHGEPGTGSGRRRQHSQSAVSNRLVSVSPTRRGLTVDGIATAHGKAHDGPLRTAGADGAHLR